MRARSIIVAIVLIFVAIPAPAQDRSGSRHLRSMQELVLTDGSHVYGTIERENSTEVEFRTMVGALLTTPRDQIVTIRPVIGRVVRGEFRREDPNNTRLLFGPTGRSLPRGEVYLGVYEALMPFVQVGITDRISIGGGTPLIFNDDDFGRLYWLTPKVQVFSGNGLHVAAGLFQGFAGDERAGIAYGVVTREVGSGAVTVGAGLGYKSGGGQGGVVMIGGEAPVRRNIKWVTENYVWDGAIVSSGGFRFFGERLSADLALGFVINGEDPVIPFPVVNFVYRF